jgi:hypothetical protein
VGVPQQKATIKSSRGLAPRRGLGTRKPKAHVCPTARKLRVIRPPIHPRVRPAENGGEFFVLCFQPVTFPRALCAQVAQASARATMATAHSGSARDRHRIGRALGPLAAVQTHSPHSGDRRARPRPGKAAAGLHRRRGREPSSQKNMKTISESKRSLLCGRVAQTGTIIYEAPQRTAGGPASRSGTVRTIPRLW